MYLAVKESSVHPRQSAYILVVNWNWKTKTTSLVSPHDCSLFAEAIAPDANAGPFKSLSLRHNSRLGKATFPSFNLYSCKGVGQGQ